MSVKLLRDQKLGTSRLKYEYEGPYKVLKSSFVVSFGMLSCIALLSGFLVPRISLIPKTIGNVFNNFLW